MVKQTKEITEQHLVDVKKPTEKEQQLTLPPLKIEVFQIRLIGDSPLICHAWSHKAKQQMLDKQQKKAKQAKEVRDPHQEFIDSPYPLEKGYGYPSTAFKNAAVDACSHVEGITKVLARGAFHVLGEMVKLDGEPRMREDMVRVGMGSADLRYRGEFSEWSCTLRVRYNTSVLSAEQIVNLFNVAGFAIGIGDWRPQRDGSHGMFHVD